MFCITCVFYLVRLPHYVLHNMCTLYVLLYLVRLPHYVLHNMCILFSEATALCFA